MQIVTNGAYVASRVKIGNYVHWASMGFLIVGFVLSFMTERFGQEAIFVSYMCLIAALILLNFGRTFTRRFGSRFRQDQWLIPALKGLDQRFTLFNYAAPTLPDHMVVGPTGLYVLVPRPNGGTVRYQNGRFSRGSLGGTLLRNIAEGGLGNPLVDVRRAMSQLAAYLRAYGSEELIAGLEARPMIVFTNLGAQLQVQDPPVPIVKSKDLKAVFRRAKTALEQERVDELKQVLGREVES